MARSRIVIVDSDENYVESLQLQFAKEFFDIIDLEIITDESYLIRLFNNPQKIDILIISEDMFFSDIQKHDIANIFLLIKSDNQDKTDSLNIVSIYKYSSVKEIFNEIVGISRLNASLALQGSKKTQVIMVTSTQGGVGKTTVAMGIARCLGLNYKKVLYINVSRLQQFQYLMKDRNCITDNDIYAELLSRREGIYHILKKVIRNENFDYLPAFKGSLMALELDFSIFKNIINDVKKSKDYEYIVIDTESTFDKYKIDLLDISDRVIFVTEQSKHSIEATDNFLSNIYFFNGDKYSFVCNKFDPNKNNYLYQQEGLSKFRVSEYIEKFSDMDIEFGDNFSKCDGIKKLAYILM